MCLDLFTQTKGAIEVNVVCLCTKLEMLCAHTDLPVKLYVSLPHMWHHRLPNDQFIPELSCEVCQQHASLS